MAAHSQLPAKQGLGKGQQDLSHNALGAAATDLPGSEERGRHVLGAETLGPGTEYHSHMAKGRRPLHHGSQRSQSDGPASLASGHEG